MKYHITFILLLLLFTNCRVIDPNLDTKDFTLVVGETIKIDAVTFLTFTEVIEDNRCPVNTTCEEQGLGAVRFILLQNDIETRFRLATQDDVERFYQQSIAFGNYRYTLLDLRPHPQITASGGTTKVGDDFIELQVERMP